MELLLSREVSVEKLLSEMNYHEMCQYLGEQCELIQGSDRDRAAFIINRRTSIKFALNDNGVAKNLCDMEKLNRLSSFGVVPYLRRYCPEGRWYMMERCVPALRYILVDMIKKVEPAVLYDCGVSKQRPVEYFQILLNKDYPKFMALVKEAGVAPFDALDPDKWVRG